MAYNGTLARGTASFTAAAAKFGSAGLAGGVYTIDGADSFLSSNGGNGGTLVGGTVEGWIKTTATSTRVAFGHDTWFWVGLLSGVPNVRFGYNDIALSGSTAINDGAWHHIALVFGASTRRLYVDGAQVASTSTGSTTGTPAAPMSIGGFNNSSNGVTSDWAGGSGLVDEVRLSNTERYTGTTYTVPAAAFTPDAYTVALYHLETDASDSSGGASTVSIAANDANFVYSPYTWDVTAARAKTINAGAYLSVLLAGSATSVVATFDMTNATAPVPQISYRIDRGQWTDTAIAASVPLPIPTTRLWSKHLVEIRVKSTSETVNRWNSPQNSAVVFTGLTVGPSTVTTTVSRKKRYTLLCFGDSITEGVRALGSTQTNDTDRNDAALGWAHPLGELLGAEVGVVGFGATGLTSAGSGNVPALPSSYASLWSGTARSFTVAPDLILINSGTNDSGDVTTAATSLLNALLAATPVSSKIAIVQQWNGTAHKTQWQAAIVASTTPARVTYVDTTGWFAAVDSSDSTHPYGYVNVADLAPRLTSAVGPLLAGSVTPKRYVNANGTAKAIA